MNVIPKIGQVWVEGDDTEGLPIDNIYTRDGKIVKIYRGIRGLSINYFHKNFTFKPGDDLEFLALNCSEWDEEWTLITRCGETFDFSDSCQLDGDYTRKQWKDKRNELFGITEELKNVDDKVGFESRMVKLDFSKFASSSIDEVAKMVSDLIDKKPVYTQAMCDAGELPPVGCECVVSVCGGDDEICTMKYAGLTSAVLLHDDDMEYWRYLPHCKFSPIGTRTDQEKLFSEVMEYMRCQGVPIGDPIQLKILMAKYPLTRKEK